jgi:hypothetical protein
MNYVSFTTPEGTLLNISLGLVSRKIRPDRLRKFMCEHPIPGSIPEDCSKLALDLGQGIWNAVSPFVGLIGGALLGFLTGGLGFILSGAIVGAQIAMGAGYFDLAGSNAAGALTVANGLRQPRIRYKGRVRGDVV